MAVEGLAYTEKCFVQPKRNVSEKNMVAIAYTDAAEDPDDPHFLHSAVNLSLIMSLLICCAWVDEVAIFHTKVQYYLPSE